MPIVLRTGHGKAARRKEWKSLSADDARKIIAAAKNPEAPGDIITIQARGDVVKSYHLSTRKQAASN